ncbi:MAG: chromosome segregation protein SMC [Parachlamydiaceae bacterium]
MRLKKLHIIGFKSFADKTSLLFDDGVTCIVGPNGCGKSNIADAIRWVLGEQSAKSLRGSKMPDIIFAGTSARKPLNYAEVAITFTEINGALPIEYEEVTVVRRLHRSGESEYFLNQQPIRLKDLHSLFLDSGIGKNSFSIFEQGKIEQVIQFTPLERRYIFEEAAGILRFLQRKKETLRKLEQTEENITRIKDIHLEVEKQVVILQEQAAKATVFKELKHTVEQHEKKLLVAKARQIHKKKAEALEQEDQQLQALLHLGENVASLEEQKKTLKKEIEKTETTLKQQNEELFQIRSDKEIKSRDKLTVEERIKETKAKEKRWQHDLEEILEQRQFRQQELVQAKKQREAAQSNVSSLEKSLQAQKEIVEALEIDVETLHKKQKHLQQEILTQLQHENHFDSELKQQEIRLESHYERQQQLNDRKTHLKTLEEGLKDQIQEKEKLVQNNQASLEQQKELLHQLEQKIELLVSEIQTQQTTYDATQKELNEGKARFKALIRLRDDYEGFSQASKRLLQEARDSNSLIYNKVKGLFELIQATPGTEEAIASALSRYSQTLVVDTASDAKAVVDFAKNQQLTDFSLVISELLPPLKESKTHHSSSLASQVSENPLSKHFLSHVLVAPPGEHASMISSQPPYTEIWCHDHVYIDQQQVFFYGIQGKNNAFMREAEIKNLEVELQRLEALRQHHDLTLKELQQTRSQLHIEMVELDKVIRRHEMHQIEASFSLQRLRADLEKNHQEYAHSESELTTLLSTIEQQQKSLLELKQRYEQAQNQTSAAKNAIAQLETELQHKTSHLSQQQRILQDVQSDCSGAAGLLQKSLHAIHLIESKENEILRQERRLEEELQIGHEFLSQMTMRSSECNQLLEKIEGLLQTAAKAYEELEKTLSRQKEQMTVIETKIADVLQSGKKQETEHHQIALLIAQLNAAYQSLEDEILDRHRLSMQEAFDLVPSSEKSIDSMERKLRELRREIESSGDINMTSIEECAKYQVRYDFLNQQIQDLGASKEGLIAIIKELDGESRKLFKETFETIRINFKKNFAILFNGGDADLQFTDHTDLLEAGIEITAKPLGKQMRSIHLLSGGEKCLTALALLFAIFEVKAGPFCILDEIDAPLDDSNVERFANIVKKFVDHTQFIIITHNKQTMSIADMLFGVSMEEKGVSKLLQMHLSKSTTPSLQAV